MLHGVINVLLVRAFKNKFATKKSLPSVCFVEPAANKGKVVSFLAKSRNISRERQEDNKIFQRNYVDKAWVFVVVPEFGGSASIESVKCFVTIYMCSSISGQKINLFVAFSGISRLQRAPISHRLGIDESTTRIRRVIALERFQLPSWVRQG